MRYVSLESYIIGEYPELPEVEAEGGGSPGHISATRDMPMKPPPSGWLHS